MNEIHSTYGIYNISGNHEFEKNSLYDVSDFMKEVEVLSSNFHYLDNKAVNIDDKIVVVGRRDFIYNGKKNSRVSIETILMRNNLENTKLPIIVLDHQPQDYRNSIKAGATLQLSGHTHNGQIFPGNIILNIFERIQYNCYSYGEYKENDFSMFITRGYGAWGFPLRTTGRSEILNINFLY
jgi:predicted MPP superfamily phosphohydrolase